MTDRQILQMLLQFMEMMEYSNNPYCILFRFALCRYIQEYIPLAEEELDEKEVIDLLMQ